MASKPIKLSKAFNVKDGKVTVQRADIEKALRNAGKTIADPNGETVEFTIQIFQGI